MMLTPMMMALLISCLLRAARESKGCDLKPKKCRGIHGFFPDSGITINEDDRCLQCFDLTFDVSVSMLFDTG
jgi:hypothetical protein